jgi:hypothetical protein
MIIENRSTEIGDVIYIQTETPLIGLVALFSFIDVVVGESTNKVFDKTFRYSVDGINWSAFIALTNTNVSNVQVQVNDTFYAEYKYERVGTDPSGDLEFDSVTLIGDFITPSNGPAYSASNFVNYFNFNNICSIAWSVNVLDKLYNKGIIPNYIERGLSGDNTTDRDFIDFWRAVTHYFALYVCLARQFQFYYQNRDLLLEYVKQRGLIVCDDISYIDLMYLMEFHYDEIRQRGTRQVFEQKATDTSVTGSKQVDGEYMRMICFDNRDEFIRNLNRNEHIGWNIGNSSPMYKGLQGVLGVNKYYIDYVADIVNLQNDLNLTDSSYPYISLYDDSKSNSISNSISTSISTNSDLDAVIIRPPGVGQSVGIGGGDRRIVINPNLDYEISFFVKCSFDTDIKIKFGVVAYDKNDNVIQLRRNDSYVISSVFLNNITLNQPDKYYFVRGILFNKNNYNVYDPLKSYDENTVVTYLGSSYKSKRQVPVNGSILNDGVIDSTPGVTSSLSPYFWDFWQVLTTQEVEINYTTSLGLGANLILQDDVVKIDPYINYVNTLGSVNNLYLHSMRVQPLSTKYSKGFVQSTNILEIWNTNNNKNISESNINKDTKHLLIPYNTILQNNFIPTEINR